MVWFDGGECLQLIMDQIVSMCCFQDIPLSNITPRILAQSTCSTDLPSIWTMSAEPVKVLRVVISRHFVLFTCGERHSIINSPGRYYLNNLFQMITVEPPVSDHPKCKDLVVAYGRWSLTRIEPQEASYEKRSEDIYFMEDNLLDYTVCSSMWLQGARCTMHTANIEIRERVKRSRTRG